MDVFLFVFTLPWIFSQADMDPTFMKNVLDGIRGTLFPKPLPCNELDKLCRQMECCFYKNKNTPHKKNESSGLAV